MEIMNITEDDNEIIEDIKKLPIIEETITEIKEEIKKNNCDMIFKFFNFLFNLILNFRKP
jgi:hypothetical protein